MNGSGGVPPDGQQRQPPPTPLHRVVYVVYEIVATAPQVKQKRLRTLRPPVTETFAIQWARTYAQTHSTHTTVERRVYHGRTLVSTTPDVAVF